MTVRMLVPTLVLAGSLALPGASSAGATDSDRLVIRDRAQTLHLYGARGRTGGRRHQRRRRLDAPRARPSPQFLAAQGWFVVGFDAKAYLSSFTSGSATLSTSDVPRDYATLVDYAAQGARGRPLLVGVSVGAGLSVLAATAPELQARVAGVVALGLPEQNELGWRFRDSTIYLTKKTPNEPLFSARRGGGTGRAGAARALPLDARRVRDAGRERRDLGRSRASRTGSGRSRRRTTASATTSPSCSDDCRRRSRGSAQASSGSR